jgi:hypothetical protein
MILKTVAEVVWRFYQDGRASSTSQTLREADIIQYCRAAYGNINRQIYYASKKINDGDESYFYSPTLDVKRFTLSEPNAVGMRRADMSEFDLYRLPHNKHIPNIYPVGQACGTEDVGQITLLDNPGEENFYLGTEYEGFMFGVIKGRGINTYHVPPCIKEIDIEATYDNDNVDVPLDIAFDVSNQVLGVALRIPGYIGKDTDNPYQTPQSLQLKRALQQQPETTI